MRTTVRETGKYRLIEHFTLTKRHASAEVPPLRVAGLRSHAVFWDVRDVDVLAHLCMFFFRRFRRKLGENIPIYTLRCFTCRWGLQLLLLLLHVIGFLSIYQTDETLCSNFRVCVYIAHKSKKLFALFKRLCVYLMKVSFRGKSSSARKYCVRAASVATSAPNVEPFVYAHIHIVTMCAKDVSVHAFTRFRRSNSNLFDILLVSFFARPQRYHR